MLLESCMRLELDVVEGKTGRKRDMSYVAVQFFAMGVFWFREIELDTCRCNAKRIFMT